MLSKITFRSVILISFIAFNAAADYIEVTRSANIKDSPESNASILRKAAAGDTFELLKSDKNNGYYAVRLPNSNDEGWVSDRRATLKAGDLPIASASTEVKFDCGEHTRFGIPHQSDQLICHAGYALGYDYANRIPDWVSYAISNTSANGNNVGRGSFRVDKSIPAKYRSSNTDYAKSGYDRGHLAPSGSIDYSRAANDDTFLYSNMTPQLPEFNRDMQGMTGVWGRIERFERAWVKERQHLVIVAGAIVGTTEHDIGRGVEVPTQFFKVIFDPAEHDAIAFLMPQDLNTGDDWQKYLVSIDDIEALTGWNLFAKVDEDIQHSMEAEKALVANWPLTQKKLSADWCDQLPSLKWGDMTLQELTYTCLPDGWEAFFKKPDVREQVSQISDYLEKELAKPNTTLSPSIGNVFRALYEVPAANAKAVIMGQDPAPQPGLATGLSFSLPPGTPTSSVASVQRVFLEAQNEQFCNDLDDADASGWADQNVLLLNMALTIPCDENHVCYGGIADHVPQWESFTQQLMTYIDTLEQPMAFILWGSKARAFKDTITRANHKAFEGGHPSPKADSSKFFCQNYFSCSNQWLKEKGGSPIDWTLGASSCDSHGACIYDWDSHSRTSSCEQPCVEVACPQ